MPLDDTTKHYEQALAPQADPFTLPALIAWLRTKRADEEYCWADTGHCLFQQYLAAHGIDAYLFAGQDVPYTKLANCFGGGRSVDVAVALARPHTFGAALARAEALAKSEA